MNTAVAPSAEPERRQLTLMFCDLVGSTALSHQLHPEDLHEVVRSYQHCTREVTARYEGFVARYEGDGILVYFGYPSAHEDDAVRAIHAGLEIVEALRQSSLRADRAHEGQLNVRIGIATGSVVVGDLAGQGVSGQAEAIGETPNLAARIQALAEPNHVVIAQRTRELAGGAFEYEDRGLHELHGFPQPVRAWRVLGPSDAESRFDAAHSQRFTPLVGRSGEMDLLLRCWQHAKSGHGQVMVLSGEAGIGKSRLAETLSERIAGEPHLRLRYQCSPYHANSALYPVIQQIERTAGFGREDTTEQKLDKLQAVLAKSVPNSAEIAAVFAALLSLPAGDRYPSLELSPQQQKDRTLAALLDRLSGLTAQAPVLIVFEDVHWIDPTSTELLGLLARQVESLPILAIITSRAEAGYPWLSLDAVRTLALQRLDSDASTAMVGRLLEGTGFAPDVVAEVVARTDGVPLFIEELAKTLTTSDLPREQASGLRSGIPSTLADSLMARLDRLGQAKEVAQMASVIGREFSRELVAAISPLDDAQLGAALEMLTASTVVFGRDQPPRTTFVFKHALLQDAAYASLLRGRRQELHGRIAGTLEASHPERIHVEPELFAHHYTEAGLSMPAAGYWAAAAQRALDRSANREALSHATKGLGLVPGIAEGADRDRLEIGLEILAGAAHRAVSGFASSQAERSFIRALGLCQRIGDIPRLIEARRGLFACYYARGALPLAREQGQHLAELGGRTGDTASRMLGHWMLGCVTFWQGEFATARSELETAFSLYDPEAQRTNTLALQIDPAVNALLHLSWTLWLLGYPEQALRTSEKAVKTARGLSQPFALAMALFWAGSTEACCGRQRSARRLLDELTAVTAEHGLGYLGSCARVLEGQYLIAHDRCAEGLQQIGSAFSEFKAQEAGVGLPWAISISATAYARLGQPNEGLAALASAFQAAVLNGERHWEAELWRLKGELLLLQKAADVSEAESCFRAAIDLAQRQAAKSLELRAATSLARLLASQGNTEPARRRLRQICDWFSEGSDTADLRNARRALDAM